MALRSKPKEEPKPSITKGFARLLGDLWLMKIPTTLTLINGQTVAGMIIENDANTLVLDRQIDRHNAELVYIPISSVVTASIEKKN